MSNKKISNPGPFPISLKGPGLARRDIFVMYYPRPCRLNGQRRRGSGRLLEGSRAAQAALAFALWHVTQRLEERAVLAVFDVAPQGVDHLGADIGRGGVALLALFDGRFELAPARTGAAVTKKTGETPTPSSGLRTPRPPRFRTWVWTMVVDTSLWPKSSCIVRMS